ncbi:hypothetical protein M404DRAFT_714605 [Pisolithus tinctorius Marx 270]|uniref:Uncharacterized protein n=1 Tax=Pisolithus tinctorius Marx 270 TaxID=870435 RepID=A0A0C3JXM8_PISTI|nr:hypothetical protein M404DRAFT_714605 [Pisolithus tinctorius Marx 270]
MRSNNCDDNGLQMDRPADGLPTSVRKRHEKSSATPSEPSSLRNPTSSSSCQPKLLSALTSAAGSEPSSNYSGKAAACQRQAIYLWHLGVLVHWPRQILRLQRSLGVGLRSSLIPLLVYSDVLSP